MNLTDRLRSVVRPAQAPSPGAATPRRELTYEPDDGYRHEAQIDLDRVADLLGGQIQAGFETTSVLFSHLQDKKINALAVATQARLPDLPEVPTMIESGFPCFIASSWTSVMAPAGTPRAIVGKLNESINAGLNTPQMQARFKQLAADARPGTPEELATFIAGEIPKWQSMAKVAGVSAE